MTLLSETRQAGAGIEVTPEMARAGYDVIRECWGDFIGGEGDRLSGAILTRVFRAMSVARDKRAL